MATKKEIKDFLNETGYTNSQMAEFYQKLIPINWIIKNFSKNSALNSWDKLAIHLIKQLPTQLEKDLKRIKAKAKEEENELNRKKKEAIEKEYYQNHFFEIMIDKIMKKEKLTETQIGDLIEYEDSRYREEGEDRRWSRTISSYIYDSNSEKWFCVEWECGLTECQENAYYNQPFEVSKRESVVTKNITFFDKV